LYRYSDEEFMNTVNDKIGNVRLFKKHLRKQGLIGNRQQFSEEHVEMFKRIREYKNSNHTTWDVAFKVGLMSIPNPNKIPITSNDIILESPQNNIEGILSEILKTLKRIEEKL
jgi:hypothetical protein